MNKKHFFAFGGILSLAVLIICQAGQAQVSVPALVQFASQNNGGADLPICSATFPSNNTAGNLIVVAVTLGATMETKPATVADTQGNVYYPATGQTDFYTVGGSGASFQLFYAANIRGGPNRVTMTERDVSTGGGNAYNAIAIHEYSGVSIASPLDVAAIGAGITTNNPFTMFSPSATTTVNGDLIFGFGNVINGPVSAGPGFTGLQTVSGVTEDLVQSTAGSIVATATDNANNDSYGMSMAAFKPLSGSLSGPVLPLQGGQVVNALSTLMITNTAVVVNTNQVTTNTIVFNYPNRSALTNDGWSFIATNPDGTPRNTETNPAVMYNQPPGTLAVPVDQGDLFGTSFNNTRNSLFRNLSTNWVSMRVQLSLNPTVDVDQAHLTLYQDDDNYIGVGLAYNDSLGGEVVTMVTETNGQVSHFWTVVNWYEGGPEYPAVTNIFLRLDTNPNSSAISGFASLDGITWALVGTFNQTLVNPRLALWACSSTVPYTNGISPICYWQQLNTFVVTPGPSLTYQLVSPPAGASIDTNGIITWTPTAQQGAAAYTIETVVTENTLTATNNCTVTVKAPLTVTANNQTRAYGQTNAPLTGMLVGVLNGDNITATYTTTAVTNSPVGTYLIVPTLNDPNNRLGFYNVTTNIGSLTVTGAVLTATANPATRAYGATNPVFTVSYSGFVNGDGTNVLSGSPVLMTSAVTNSRVGNYVITNTIGTLVATNYTVSLVNGSLTVTKAALTITAVGNTKTYDGTTNAAATPTVSGLKGSDTVTGLAESYATKSVGTGKTLSVSAYTVNDGNGGNNYSVSTVASTAGVINAAVLTITAVGNSKTYDGTTNALAIPTVSGLQGSDTVTGLAESYATKNVGTGKTVNVSGYTVNDGNGGNNYSVGTVASPAGVINAAGLTITALANSKTYDGTTNAAAIPTVSGLQGSDSVTGLAESYATKNVGTGKTVNVSGYTVNDGNGGNNYSVGTVASPAGVINAAGLTITALANSKTYDGTTNAAAIPTVSGLQGTDSVTGLAESYATKNVGTGKTLSVSAYTVNDGNGGNNYSVGTVASPAGVINVEALTITALANSKTYDGTTNAAAIPTVTGLQGSDTVTGLAESYDTKNVGTGKTLSVSAYTVNDGNGGNNYSVGTATSPAGVINAAGLTISAVGNTKTYDGTTNALAIPTVSGLQGSDTVTGLAESYATKNVGTGKTLGVIGYTVNDGNGGNNYSVGTVASTAGVINAAGLTISAVGNTKTYDGTTNATAIPTVSGLQGSDTVTGLAESYATKNVGTGKTLNVSGYTVNDGNGGNNYSVSTAASTAGVINVAGLTLTAAGNTKTYDGTTNALAIPTVSGLQGSDAVTGLAESYDTKNVGTGKTLSVIGYTVNDGNGGNNYSVGTVASTAGVINAAVLTYTANAAGMVYGSAVPGLSGTVSGFVGTDNQGNAVTGTMAFTTGATTASVVGSYAINGSGLTANSGNYTFMQALGNATALTINALPVTLTGTRSYDGTTVVGAGILTVANKVGSDNVTVAAGSGTLAGANVGLEAITLFGTLSLGGSAAGNYTVAGASGSVSITVSAVALTVTNLVALDKVYDGTTNATLNATNAGLAGVLNGDSVTLVTSNGVGYFGDKDVGTNKPVTVRGLELGGAAAGNYTLADPTNLTANITAAGLTVSGVTAASKVYDGTTNAPLNGTAILNGEVSGDNVSLVTNGVSAAFAGPNVGSNLVVTVSGYGLTGADASNYTLTQPSGLAANITTAGLTISAVGNTKTYDGTTNALAIPTVSGLQGSDTVTGLAESYATKNVGTGKTLGVIGYTVNDGNGGNNYSVGTVASTAGVINAAGLTISAVGNTKTYDGTTNATAIPTVSGLQGSDTVTGLAESYATKNVGTGKTLNVSGYTVNDGNGGNNYSVSTAASTAGVINVAGLTLTAAGNTKTYDGTTNALAIPTVSGLQGSDAVTGLAESYDTKNVGTGKTLSVIGYTVNDGNGGNNYSVGTVASTAGVINAAVLTYTANAAGMVYGSAVPGLSGTVSGFVGTDNQGNAVTGTMAFTTGATTASVVGSYAINGSGLTANSGNYTFMQALGNATALTINALPVTLTGTRSYDGTTVVGAGILTVANKVGSDNVTVAAGSGTLAGANVGLEAITLFGTLSLGGSAAGNYTVAGASGSVSITVSAVALTVTNLVALDKVYDGTTNATLNATNAGLAGVLNGDSVTLVTSNGVGYFGDKDVGTNKPVTVRGLELGGAAAGNYTLADPTNLTANITAAGLTVSGVTAASKVYDGTTNAPLNGTAILNGEVSGDNVSLVTNGVSAAFAGPNVGSNLVVTVSGYGLTGADASNYTLTQPSGLAANITTAGLTISAVGNTKTYDGTTNALAIPTVSGLQGSDTVTGLAESYATKNVGTGKTLGVIGYTVNDGNGGNNYSVGTVASTAGVINAAGLTISAVGNTKTYDGTTNATAIPTVSGLQGSDTVTGLAESYATKNVGTGKTLNVSGYTVNDGNGGNNYSVSTAASTAGVINVAGLTLTAAGNTKTYDGTTNALAIPTVSGLQGSDAVTGLAESYDTKNVGTGKTLSVIGYTVNDGNGGNNYSVGTVASTAGVINAAVLTYTANAAGMVYGSAVPGLSGTVSGFVGTDNQGNAVTGTMAFTTGATTASVVGSYAINGSGLTANSGNYTFMQALGNATALTINALPVTLTGTRSYDGTTVVGAGILTVANKVGSDNVTVAAGSGTLAGANVGLEAITLFGTLSLGGSAAGNYTVAGASGSVSITVSAVALTVTNLVALDKVYDGTTNATLNATNAGLAGVLNGDSVTLVTSNGVGYFGDKDVGTNKPVTVRGLELGGAAAGNYTLADPTNLTANITAKAITIASVPSPVITSVRLTNGVATITWNSVAGGIYGMQYSDSLNGAVWNDLLPDVTATGSTANQTNVVSGVPQRFYRIMVLNPGITANNKVYDGTTTATISSNNVVLVGVVSGDTVSLSTNGYTANFVSANVGTGIAVTISGLSLSGPSAPNYTLTQPVGLTANITPATLTASAVNMSRTFGLPNSLTVSYNGFVHSEGTNVLTGAPSLSTSATTNSPPGTYPITIGPGTLSATNYAFVFNGGTLTVVGLPQLSGVALKGNQFVFNLPTITGQTYQIEYKDNLTATTWSLLGGPIAGTGYPIVITNGLSASPQRFFRLKISPP